MKMLEINDVVEDDVNDIIHRCGEILNNLEGKTLLVTGSKGMIGSYFLHTVYKLNKHFKNKTFKSENYVGHPFAT